MLGSLAELLDQLAANFLGKISALILILLALPGNEPERHRLGLIGARPRYPAIGDHFLQNPVAAPDCGTRMFGAAVTLRRLRQGSQKRHFVQFERIHALAEIGLCGRFDAERLTAKRDFIHIERNDLLLVQRAFDAIGKDRLLDLARVAIFVGQQQVFRHLLRDCRRPARAARARQIVENRDNNADIIDAAMAEEILVLCRQIGADEHRRKIGIIELYPAFARIAVERLAVDVAHHGGQWRFIFNQRLGIGQIAEQHGPQQDITEHQPADRIGTQAEPFLLPIGLKLLP